MASLELGKKYVATFDESRRSISNGQPDPREMQEVELGEAGSGKGARSQVETTEDFEEEGESLLEGRRARSTSNNRTPAGTRLAARYLNLKTWVDFFRSWKWDLEPFYGPFGLHLALSVFLNAALVLLLFVLFVRQLATPTCSPGVALGGIQGGWALPAVAAAVDAFNEECSGHGDRWTDTIDGKAMCECHQCYVGPFCSVLHEDCEIDASGGNPLMFQEFWRLNAKKGSVLIPANYRIGYKNNGHGSVLASHALEDAIRLIHSQVGNAVTDGRHIVIGAGSTMLVNAAMFALADRNDTDTAGNPLLVTTAPPYYQGYAVNAEYFHSHLFSWGGPTDSPVVQQSDRTLEFVTTPNNPDGTLRTPKLGNPNGFTVFDLAYYWPHYSPITVAADHDVMLFTLSKLTGHAGTRIGWAIVKNAGVAHRMQVAIERMTIGVSHESQLRASEVLHSVSNDLARLRGPPPVPANGIEDAARFAVQGHMFSYASSLMQDRWQRLQEIFSSVAVPGTQPRFSIQELGKAEYCNFFKASIPPSPAYAWIRCDSPEDKDCFQVFRSFKIIGRSGQVYGAEQQFIRLNLMMAQSTFDVLTDRLLFLLVQG